MSIPAAVGLLCALFGLLIGSFLNVVIWRVPRGESVVRPPSHCPECGVTLGARDNVPVVSWLLLRGRCRHCRAPISARYPTVELTTAALFGLLAWRFGPTPQLPAFLYLAAIGVALAAIDIDVRRLPNVLTLPSYPVALALLGAAAAGGGDAGRFERGLIGMVALFTFYFVLVVVYPAGMGMGDLKLSGVLGLYLGWIGYGTLAVGAFLSFLLGGLVGVVLIAASGAGRKTRVPFGPFMIAGTLIAVFVGHAIASHYVGMTIH